MNLKIIDVSFHRNGIAGEGFTSVLFDDSEHGRMHGTLFDKDGYCAVHNVQLLAAGNIKFGENSWRGDRYASELRPLIDAWLKKHGTNRVLGIFSI